MFAVESIGEGIKLGFFMLMAGVGILGWRFRKFDSDGQIKSAAKGTIVRALGNLFLKK
jgi:hypothetical protein